MKDIFSFFEKPKSVSDLKGLTIKLLNDERIRELSHGQIRKPETLNYRTLKPEHDGLFCAKVFGPVMDYECLCGKYTRMKHRGIVCEKCGVEVIQSKVRRERFGHVEFPVPLIHPWGFDALAEVLNRPVSEVYRIADEQLSIDMTEIAPAPSLDAAGSALTGQEALEAAAGDAGKHLFFRAWPVLPPDLRPLVPLSGGRFATSDLNDLYRRLINRRNRLARLIELNAPVIIIRNEIRELQASLDAVVQNGMRGRKIKGPNAVLKSLFDMIGADQGHLRTHRGKQADYSGAAIAVPADVAPDTIRLPREIAFEVFKPWIYNRLEALGYTTTIKSAKRMVERRGPEVLDALEIGTREHPVILMHGARVGGFSIELWDELAVGMNTEAMDAMGVGDAGDVVQIHIPGCDAAIRETRALGVGVVATEADEPSGWLGKAIRSPADALPKLLMDSAIHETTDSLGDRSARRLLGMIGNPNADSTGERVESWLAPAPRKPEPEPGESQLNDMLFRHVEEIEFSIRLANCLQNMNIQFIGELVQRTEGEFLKTKNFGRGQLRELKEILADMGLGLGLKIPNWQQELDARGISTPKPYVPAARPARIESRPAPSPESSEPRGYDDDDFEDFD